SWYFHHLPKRLHRAEVLGNHFAQLVVPWFLFFPQPIATLAGIVITVTQAWLLLSGNFSWLNVITIALAISAFDDAALRRLIPSAPGALELPVPYLALALIVTALILLLSYRPARNLVSRHQLMNYSFDPLHIVGTYGAFGSITKERYEIVIEGTDALPLTAQTTWREYELKGKPGDVRRRPPQFAPCRVRLDWLMWFAAMSSPTDHPWFTALVVRLLQGDPETIGLLRSNPFPDHPPRYIRALYYEYRFSTRDEHRQTGRWRDRRLLGLYFSPVALTVGEPREPALK